jgi:hypothetical protein
MLSDRNTWIERSLFLKELQISRYIARFNYSRHMKRFLLFVLGITLSGSYISFSQSPTNGDAQFYTGVKKWFTAWELVSRKIYRLEKTDPVDFIFFDEQFVYATSEI